MFKLIFFLIGLAAAITFSAFNIGNTADISFGFKVLEDIPIFLSIAISFLAGAIFTLPFAFYVSIGKRRSKKKDDAPAFVPDHNPDVFVPENRE
ncbi:MAG TPA: hypothetical protein DCO79_14415 [Spirochaeta sp.]|nr:hypothetical protein [Spirochaeta sp.]